MNITRKVFVLACACLGLMAGGEIVLADTTPFVRDLIVLTDWFKGGFDAVPFR